MSIADELGKLDELRQRGVLSFREFETLKDKLLNLADDAGSFGQLDEITVADVDSKLDLDLVASSQLDKCSTPDEIPQLDVDVSDEELGLNAKTISQLDDIDALDEIPQLDVDVSDEELDLDVESLSMLSGVQVVDQVPELDLNGSSEFEKIEIPEELSRAEPESNLNRSELSQLGENELLTKVAEMEEQLETLRAQGNVARVDRLWKIEKKRYEVVGEHGQRHVPSKEGSILVGVGVVAIGIFWMISTFGSTVSLVGFVFIVVGVATSVYSYRQADQYERAKKRYMRRRTKVNQKR